MRSVSPAMRPTKLRYKFPLYARNFNAKDDHRSKQIKRYILYSIIIVCIAIPLILHITQYENQSSNVIMQKLSSLSFFISKECQHLHSIRKKDRIPLDPSVQSIFNCHNTLYGKCQYYRPAHFFHPKCGIHTRKHASRLSSSFLSSYYDDHSINVKSNFQNQLQQMNELKSNYQLWASQPPILIPFVSYMTEMIMKKSGQHFDRHNLSFIHVHKTGGTSIHQAMRDLKLYDNEDTILVNDGSKADEFINVHKDYYKSMYHVYQQTRPLKLSEIVVKKTHHFLNKAVRYQPLDKWDSVDVEALGEDPSMEPPVKKKNVYNKMKSNDLNHMMFALVRDPVERFISAVGQVTSIKFSKKGSGLKLKNECIPPSSLSSPLPQEDELTTSDVLKCFVNIIKEKGYWVDVHFTPMILEISFAIMEKDIPVGIFHFDSLPDVLSNLGFDPRIKKKNGKSQGYRQHLLVNATVDDFELDVKRELCYLYLMDVLFMKDLGYATHCDSIVFRNL